MSVFIAAFVTSLVASGLLVPLLRRAQFIDVPNHRSSHTSPVPRGGGLAVMAAVSIGAVVQGVRGDDVPLAILITGISAAAVGMADDIRSMSGRARLGLQVLVSLGVTWWALTSSRDLAASWPVVAAISIFAVVAYINAFNFMDGINGISSLSALVAGLFWGLDGARLHEPALEALGFAVAGGALGFLPWNAPRARVFLGDVGSYGLGLLIASMSLWAWAEGASPAVAAAPLVIYGADTGWVLLKRVSGRRPLMEAHREHVYQRLVDGGWPHLAAASLSAGTGAMTCVIVFAMWRELPIVAVALVALLVFAYLASPRLVRVPVAT